jgi:hypothetical protein
MIRGAASVAAGSAVAAASPAATVMSRRAVSTTASPATSDSVEPADGFACPVPGAGLGSVTAAAGFGSVTAAAADAGLDFALGRRGARGPTSGSGIATSSVLSIVANGEVEARK